MKRIKNSLKKPLLGFLSVLIVIGITIGALEYFSTYKVTNSIHLDAPVITRKFVVINAPVEQVWKVFSEVNNWHSWQKEIVSPKLNGRFEVGSTFNWKSNGLTITSTLNQVELNKVVSWSGPAFGAFAIHRWSFSEKDGQTIVSVEESMEGWLVKLLKKKFQTSLDASIENWLQYLKAAAEQE